MILYEKEICDFLSLPAIPKKEWDNESSFDKGVAVTQLSYGGLAYAVCTFNKDVDKEPRIIKVFSGMPFKKVLGIFIVPSYMETDTTDADLDDESKKKADDLAKEAEELANEGVSDQVQMPENEYCFDHIHNDEEAIAFIKAYNKENNIGGKVPSKHETILMRLSVIYAEVMKNAPKGEDAITTDANAAGDGVDATITDEQANDETAETETQDGGEGGDDDTTTTNEDNTDEE